ncbi:DUF3108 domain-containing protein [Longimicrobium sp.]|uniref:DUF3108 domain-containing protein n=1 Tax=Longimicrobium sp. TaxID=2029185 RepID=UPI003B3B36EB
MGWMKMGRRTLTLAVVVAAFASPAAEAQRLPFAPGEHAEYQVKLGPVTAGSATLSVTGVETLQGQQTLHTRMTLRGGTPFYRIDDRYESWIDTDGLFSRRFHQNLREGGYRRNRTYDFNPERRTFRRENGETGTLPTGEPLDDLSFLYFARTLPLEVGATYRLPRYFKADGNPVILQVLRRETIRVPAGQFRAIVVRPIIRTDGLFSEQGRAEVYFSDDQYRIPVFIRTDASKLPATITMRLRSFRPGA